MIDVPDAVFYEEKLQSLLLEMQDPAPGLGDVPEADASRDDVLDFSLNLCTTDLSSSSVAEVITMILVLIRISEENI